MNEWIDVNERLPATGGTYLVVFETVNMGDRFTSVGEFDINYKHWEMVQSMREYPSQEYLFSDYSMKITHWMPLPKPPVT
jgi:hypothetical protein